MLTSPTAPTLRSIADTTAWFRHRLPAVHPDVQDVEITAIERASRGVSRETWLLDAEVTRNGVTAREGFAVRRDHEVGTVDPVPLRTEYEVYRRLARSRVPVTVTQWYEDDPAWMPDGRPAYVRTKVEGDWRLPVLFSRDPADDERKIEISKEHIDHLALIHTSDWKALGFDEVFTVPTGLDDVAENLIRTFTGRLAAIAFEPSPVFAEGLDWLRATAPAAPCLTLCKGTNGLGEEVWRDGHLVAMSDWELSCIAEPAYDFAQIQEMVPVVERDGRRLWGWPEALAHYERRTGIPVTMARVEYYRRFYAVPMFLFCHHAGHLVQHEGNRLARFAWTSTEMQYQAELRFAAAAGFLPGVTR